MNVDEPVVPSVQAPVPTPETALRVLEKRDWWLWAVTCIFLLSLTVAIHTFTLKGTASFHDSWWEGQQTAVYYVGLLVLLFIVFAVHRQWLFNRLRRQLSAQSNLVPELKTRADVFPMRSSTNPLPFARNRRFAL